MHLTCSRCSINPSPDLFPHLFTHRELQTLISRRANSVSSKNFNHVPLPPQDAWVTSFLIIEDVTPLYPFSHLLWLLWKFVPSILLPFFISVIWASKCWSLSTLKIISSSLPSSMPPSFSPFYHCTSWNTELHFLELVIKGPSRTLTAKPSGVSRASTPSSSHCARRRTPSWCLQLSRKPLWPLLAQSPATFSAPDTSILQRSSSVSGYCRFA